MTSLYDILGVARDAAADVIKAAYRKLAMLHHPDRHGGDDAHFKTVQQAYEVLSDAERRARYDETGSTTPRASIEDKARQALVQMTEDALDEIGKRGENEPDYVDLPQVIRDGVNGTRQGNEQILLQLQRRIRQRKSAIRRLIRREGDGPNVMVEALQAGVVRLEAEVTGVKEKQALIHAVLDLLAEYDYRADVKPQPIDKSWMSMPSPMPWGGL